MPSKPSRWTRAGKSLLWSLVCFGVAWAFTTSPMQTPSPITFWLFLFLLALGLPFVLRRPTG
jgi:hypothetical protein